MPCGQYVLFDEQRMACRTMGLCSIGALVMPLVGLKMRCGLFLGLGCVAVGTGDELCCHRHISSVGGAPADRGGVVSVGRLRL